jgi:hypothetical protein
MLPSDAFGVNDRPIAIDLPLKFRRAVGRQAGLRQEFHSATIGYGVFGLDALLQVSARFHEGVGRFSVDFGGVSH